MKQKKIQPRREHHPLGLRGATDAQIINNRHDSPRGQYNDENSIEGDDGVEGFEMKKRNAVQVANSISGHFKYKFFSGDVDKSINNMISDYNMFTDQLELWDTRKALLFDNILMEPAKTFYPNKINAPMNFNKSRTSCYWHSTQVTDRRNHNAELID